MTVGTKKLNVATGTHKSSYMPSAKSNTIPAHFSTAMGNVPRSAAKWLLVLVSGLFLTACASAPKMQPYAEPDNVGTINPGDIVGEWRAKVINSGAASDDQPVTSYTFQEDGTWLATVKSGAESGIDFEMEGNGTWTIEGEMLRSVVKEVRNVSDNTLSNIMTGIIRKGMEKNTNAVNPYSVTANQIIWVAENGTAMQLDRM